MKKLMIALVAALTLGFATETKAENSTWRWSPLGIGLFAPVQLPFTDSHVYGLRFGGLLGWNENVAGLDCGLVNVVKGDFGGIQVGGVNYNAAIAGGIQAGVISWTELNYYGLQAAVANVNQRQQIGLSVGAMNWADSVIVGQIGVFNFANEVTGFQIGLINATEDMSGIQIGAINMITSSPVPVLPFVNVQF